MAINFDSLPQESPFTLPAPDIYKAKITEADVRTSKTSGNPYLNLKLALTNAAGKNCGSIYDILSESESSVVQYKIGRFIKACGIPLQGSMEFSDIAKLVLNKDIVVDVTIDKKSEPPRAQVDIFSHEAYYPIGQFDEIYKIVHANDGTFTEETAATAEENPFMNVPEGADEEVEF